MADFDTGDFERKPYDPPKILHTFLWDDVALSPVIAKATVRDVWAFSDSKDDVDSATDAGGHYKVRTDYALR